MKILLQSFVASAILFNLTINAANVTVITSEQQFNDLIINSKKPAIVKVGAPNCPACVSAEQPFHKLSGEFPDIIFATMDYYKNEALAKKYDIQSFPTFLYFKEGKVTSRQVGYEGNFKTTARNTLMRMKPTTTQATPEKKSPEVVPATLNPETRAKAAAPEAPTQPLACPAQGESVLEQGYAKIRDFFISLGNTIHSWFK